MLQAAAAAMAITALAHSVVGEKRLVGPLLARDIDVLDEYRGMLVRFAWHFTSVLMLVTAALVVWPGTPAPLIRLTGGVWLFVGILDAVLTRGRHIGWPFLSLGGLLAIIGAGQ